MTFDILCKMLDIPMDVVRKMVQYNTENVSVLDETLWQQLKKREGWGNSRD